MVKHKAIVALTALATATVTTAQQAAAPANVQAAPTSSSERICQMVVNPNVGATPYKLCLTKAEWDAKKLADSKDANRIVCHFEQDPQSRFRSNKICQPQSAWDEQRRVERESVEQIQRSVCVAGAGC